MHLERDGFLVSDDPQRLDIDVIERLLRSSYWAPDRSRRDIEEAYRGKGLGRWMLQAVLDAPNLRGMRRWILATLDAHGLYADYGFTLMPHPERWMERIAD